MREELAPHVKDITRALENKVSEEDIAKELDNYLNVYRVSLETAKRSIVKKHGGSPNRLAVGLTKSLNQLLPNESSVNLLCRVVTVNPKEIEVDGKTKAIYYGILGDETGTVPFTAWETKDLTLQKGDVISVQNAYTKEFRGQVQINFGNRTTVKKESKDVMALPSGPAMEPKAYKLKELNGGLNNVSVTAMVLSVEKREVEVDGQAKQVFSGLMADEGGKVQFSAWGDFGLKEGDVVRIEGGYVRSWRGVPQLSFDERCNVEKLNDRAMPSMEELMKSQRVWIEDLAEMGGAVDITVRGIIIDVKDGSGLVYRCPECRRVVRRGSCRIHGEVQGEADLRVKAVIDDGSGALTAIFGKELTGEFLGKSIDECIHEAKEAMNQEIVRDRLADILIAQPVEARGNVTSDDFGLMMIVNSAKVLRIDVQAEARAMLEELEV